MLSRIFNKEYFHEIGGTTIKVRFSGIVSPPSRVWTENVSGRSALIRWTIGEFIGFTTIIINLFVMTLRRVGNPLKLLRARDWVCDFPPITRNSQ